jgi:outer membrane protein assembly factor BamD
MNRFCKFIFAALTCTLLLSGCSDYNKILKSDSVDKKLEAAYKYYDKKDYYRAGTLFEAVIPLIRGREDAEKVQFLYAYTQYYEQSFALSAFEFKNFYDTYGRSPYAEESLFLYAKSLYSDSPEFNLDQTNTETSIAAIQDFLNRYPESKLTGEANKRYEELAAKLERKAFESAKLYHQMRYYQAAVTAFNSFARSYPSSAFNEEAGYYKIVSQFNLAEESVPEKQRERYFDTIGFYQAFLDKYPQSRLLKSAENYYDRSTRALERIKSAPTTATVEEEKKKD